MILLYDNTPIGEISQPRFDEMFWMIGEFKPYDYFLKFKEFFEYMTDEDCDFTIDPPFPEEFFMSHFWSLEEDGNTKGIEVPAVHTDGTIYWRWTSPDDISTYPRWSSLK